MITTTQSDQLADVNRRLELHEAAEAEKARVKRQEGPYGVFKKALSDLERLVAQLESDIR
ncbi:MAG: hypothetical protein JNM66_08520 [Bryobacterales bacterium]|nr:hypothetical protein [Bryobacterales bacterium]